MGGKQTSETTVVLATFPDHDSQEKKFTAKGEFQSKKRILDKFYDLSADNVKVEKVKEKTSK